MLAQVVSYSSNLSQGLRSVTGCLLACTVWLCWTTTFAWAQLNNSAGGIIYDNAGPTDTLSVKYLIESAGADNYGLLHVDIASLGPSSRERNLELRLYTTVDVAGSVRSVLFKRTVTLSEGASRLSTSIPFFFQSEMVYSNNQRAELNWDLGVFEDNRDIEDGRDLEFGFGGGYTPLKLGPGERPDFYMHSRTQMTSTALHLVDTDSSPSGQDALTVQEMQSVQSSARGVLGLANSMQVSNAFDLARDPNRLASQRHIASAPTQWQYYLQFRLVTLDLATLDRLQATNPSAASAIKQYVAAGGNLIVTGSPGRDAKPWIDQWLGDKPDGPSLWRPIHSPSQIFRDYENTTRASSAMAGSAQINQPVAGWQGGALPPTAVQSLAVDQLPADAQVAKPVRRAIQGAGGPMTRSGFLRDVLLLVNMWWQSESTQHAMVLDELWATLVYSESDRGLVDIYGNRIDPETGQVYSLNGEATESTGSTDPTQPSKLLVDWNSVLPEGTPRLSLPLLSFDLTWAPSYLLGQADAAIDSIQKLDPSGVSIRALSMGRIATVEPNLDSYLDGTLNQLSEQLTPSISVRTSDAIDGAWNVRNMIESVGKPPVWTFCGIVLLFGLMLGPGLLALTGWIGRRSLMIFLVPAISVVTTGLIVGYEVLHEGFGTTVRLTSVLAVDEVTGEGFAWSRQTYFSGWPPREGQLFPNDVYFRPVNAVTPYYYNRSMVGYQSRHPRDVLQVGVEFRDDGTRMTGGVKARQQTQFLLGQPVKAKSPITLSNTSRKTIEIKNVSGHSLPFVFLRGASTDYYFCEEIGPGESKVLEQQSFDNVAGSLSRLRADYLPDIPQGVRGTWWGTESNIGQDVIDVAWLSQLNEQLDKSFLAPYGFVTLQPAVPEIFVPVKGEVVESITLTIGRLAW